MFNNERFSTSELEEHIKNIYAKIEPIARKDGVFKPLDDCFGNGTPNNRDGSFCYSDKEGYHYCVMERGLLTTNIVTSNLNEITYLVISSDVFWMAVNFERKNRVAGKDFRRLLFQKELEYWSILGNGFLEKAENKIKESIEKAPFVDK